MSYEVLDSKVTYQGKILKVTVDTLRMPDGNPAVRETVIRGKNAAAVLAVDNDGKLVFVRQYRHGFREMLLEIPAGVLEDGEDALTGIKRELEEETGKIAGNMEFLFEMYPTVGFCSEKIYVYLATDLSEGVQHFDADEFIEVERYTLEEAVNMIFDGKIKDSKTIAAILAYQNRILQQKA